MRISGGGSKIVYNIYSHGSSLIPEHSFYTIDKGFKIINIIIAVFGPDDENTVRHGSWIYHLDMFDMGIYEMERRALSVVMR
jgi:hypothetical protein